jgi:UrcA family protein
MKQFSPKITLSSIALALCLPVTSALAGDGQHSRGNAFMTHSMTVHYADLDLDSADDLNTLYSRIERAARQVCGRADGRNLAMVAQWRTCRGEALDTAVSRIGNAQLSELHRKRDASSQQHALVASVLHDAG